MTATLSMLPSSIATALLLLVQIDTGSAQTCPSTFVGSENYLIAPSSGTCNYATRSCKKDNCCGSCFSISDADKILRDQDLPYEAHCWAYTCGDMCQDTPCEACSDHFTPLPTDDTGSRPSDGGECPASRPHKTTDGCCGACRDDADGVYAYECRVEEPSRTAPLDLFPSRCSRTDSGEQYYVKPETDPTGFLVPQCQTVAQGFTQPPSPPPPLPMCDGPYDAGTANSASCGVSSVNDVKVSCSPTGCESGCPGFKEAGTPQVLCSSLVTSWCDGIIAGTATECRSERQSAMNGVVLSCTPTGCHDGCPGFTPDRPGRVPCASDSELNIGPIIGGAGEQRPCNPAPLARRALPQCDPAQLAPRVACPAHSWRLAGALLHLRAGWRRHLLDHEEEEGGGRRRRRPGAGRCGPVRTGRRRR